MPDFLEEGDRERQAMLEQAERELRETLAKMEQKISLILFTDLVINEPFSEALSSFEDLSNPYWKKDRANATAG